MDGISEKEVMDIIQNAFEHDGIQITPDSSMDNIPEWDSLAQVNIIVALDQIFSGNVGHLQEMAEAYSVQRILQVLKDNSLI
jgi:acyl carrier protein